MGIAFQLSCTALEGTNKAGIMTPDSEGYYNDVVVGGIGVTCSNGEYYNVEQLRNMLFRTGAFVRRINEGSLRGELGHPRREPGSSKMEWLQRICTIVEEKECVHIHTVKAGDSPVKGRDGQYITPILARLKPDGVYGHVLENKIKDKNQNTCFSVRCLVRPHFNRNENRHESFITNLVTFDYVNEPGVSAARKWSNPSLQSLIEDVPDELELFTHHVVQAAFDDAMNRPDSMQSSLEMLRELQEESLRLVKVSSLPKGPIQW